MTDVINATPAATSASPGGEVKWIGSAADVSRLINEGSSGRNNARIVMGIALGGIFLDAYDLGSLAFGLKDITREFNLTPAGTGMVASAITFGAIVGALLGGYLTDKIGRYRVFMADMLFFVVAAIACALAPNEYVLTGARFVMGLGVGIDLPVAMAFLSEFARLKGPGNKAASVAMWCPTWYAAISISYLLVLFFYAVLPESHSDWLWRIILGFGAIPALVIIAIRSRYMSESPVWAANQGNLREAASILRQAYNIVRSAGDHLQLLRAIDADDDFDFAGAESAVRFRGRDTGGTPGTALRGVADVAGGLWLPADGAARPGADWPP